MSLLGGDGGQRVPCAEWKPCSRRKGRCRHRELALFRAKHVATDESMIRGRSASRRATTLFDCSSKNGATVPWASVVPLDPGKVRRPSTFLVATFTATSFHSSPVAVLRSRAHAQGPSLRLRPSFPASGLSVSDQNRRYGRIRPSQGSTARQKAHHLVQIFDVFGSRLAAPLRAASWRDRRAARTSVTAKGPGLRAPGSRPPRAFPELLGSSGSARVRPRMPTVAGAAPGLHRLPT